MIRTNEQRLESEMANDIHRTIDLSWSQLQGINAVISNFATLSPKGTFAAGAAALEIFAAHVETIEVAAGSSEVRAGANTAFAAAASRARFLAQEFRNHFVECDRLDDRAGGEFSAGSRHSRAR